MQNFHISSKKNTPQTEKADDNQIANSAGGFSFGVDKWTQLNRFLILGIEGGSYYASEKYLAKESTAVIEDCIKEDPIRTVDIITDIAVNNRAIKADTCIFSLAVCAASSNDECKAAAYQAVVKVCKIPTHLFHFLTYSKDLRAGFGGSGFHRAIARYYLNTDIKKLGMHVIKYKQRDGWTHKDLLRISHPKTNEPVRQAVLRYASGGLKSLENKVVTRKRGDKSKTFEYESLSDYLPEQIYMHEEAMQLDPNNKNELSKLTKLITDYKLTHEMIPKSGQNYPEVWEALAPAMPLGATLRNLGNFGRSGLLKPAADFVNVIVNKLKDEEAIKRSGIHPFNVLIALKAYSVGGRLKGNKNKFYYSKPEKEWQVVNKVVNALDSMFYRAFDNIQPTGSRILFGIDCSGSMSSPISGNPLISCREGAALMAMVNARVEENYHFMGFTSAGRYTWGKRRSGDDGMADLPIDGNTKLKDAIAAMEKFNWGATDCSLPFKYAQKHNLEIDVFGVYTDSETYDGTPHAHQALANYRKTSGINAKSYVVGMTANKFSIANPRDPRMLDLVGFDPNSPRVISEFISEEL
jgi:60 kDa SS-A/Ro ribonucleoprotein